MKKLMLVCCFVIGACAATFAQGGGMRRSPEEQAKNLQAQLKLTDDQTAKVTAIYAAQVAKRDSVLKANNGDMQAARGMMRPMMEETNKKVKAILTPEQVTAFDKWQAERMNRMRNGGGQGGQGGGATPPPSK